MTAIYVGLWFVSGIVAVALALAVEKKGWSADEAPMILLALVGPILLLLIFAYIIFELPKESK